MGSLLIEKFRDVLCSAQAPVVRDARLLLGRSGKLAAYYAPFEHINDAARVVLVGMTPGPTQMVNANNEARRQLLGGATLDEALRAAKNTGAFSGEPLRSNLIAQLNHWGFHQWLGLPDAGELFGPARELLHTTSLLRFPVFVDSDDYRGAPRLLRTPFLRAFLQHYFLHEVEQLHQAVFVGLGPAVQQVLDELASQELIDGKRVIGGMLHPSGNCTYRIKYLVGNRTGPVPHATNPVPYDQGRARFRATCLR